MVNELLNNKVLIAFGSNLGNRRKNIKKGVELLVKDGLKIIRCSPYYETEPVEGVTGKKFLNGVLLVETTLKPQTLLRILQEIEKKVGRPRTHRPKESRSLDLDIIYYEDLIVNKPNLQIPHPKRLERWFVIKPAAEVAPDFSDPILKKRLSVIPACFRQESNGFPLTTRGNDIKKK